MIQEKVWSFSTFLRFEAIRVIFKSLMLRRIIFLISFLENCCGFLGFLQIMNANLGSALNIENNFCSGSVG